MPDARLQVVVEAVDKFSTNLKAIGRTTEDFSRTFRNAGLILSGFGAAGVLAIRSFSNAALDQRRAMAQLQVAVGNTGAEFARVKDRIEETTLALQRKTNFADEEQLRALALMVPALGNVETALAALPTALDLAAATGQGLSVVAMQLGRVLSGQQATIQGLPVNFSKATDAAGKLALAQKALGGTAEATLDPFRRMSNALGELKETIGEELLPTVSRFTGILTDLATAAERVNPAILKLAGAFMLVGTFVASIAGPLLLFLGMMPTVIASVKALAAGIAVLAAAAAPVALVIFSIVVALAAVASAVDNVRRILSGKEPLYPWEQLSLLLDILKRKWQDLVAPIEAVTEAAMTAAEEIAYLQSLVSKGFEVGRPWITERLEELLTGTMEPAFKRMKEQFEALNIPLTPLQEQFEALRRAGLGMAAAQQVAAIWAEAYLQKQFDIIAASKEGGEEILEAMRKADVGFLEMRRRLEELPLKKVFDEATESIKNMLEGIEELGDTWETILKKLTLEEAIGELARLKEGGLLTLRALQEAGASLEEQWKVLESLPAKIADQVEAMQHRIDAALRAQQMTPLADIRKQIEALEAELAGGVSMWRESQILALLDNLRAAMTYVYGLQAGGVSEEMSRWILEQQKKMTFRIPSEGGTPWQTPEVPEFAFQHGGIVTRPTRAIIGESGPEAVIPLRRITPYIGTEPTLQHGGIVTHSTLAFLRESGPEAVIPFKGKQAPMFNVTLTLDGRVLTTVLGRLAENDEAVRSS